MKENYKPIKQFKASDLVVQDIWSSIINGELKPGDKLASERELGEQFEVSKVTLREGLQKLEAYGLIERKRGASGGAIVQEVAPTKGLELIMDYLNLKGHTLNELINARTVIDPYVASEAATNITDEGIDKLGNLMEKHQVESRTYGHSRFGIHFEPFLAELAGNYIFKVIEELLLLLVQDVEAKMDREKPENKELLEEYYREVCHDHENIANAVMSRKPQNARKMMLKHRQNWGEMIQKVHLKF
jgi:DNA-binding FadR family transcriptional regulator